MTGEVSYGSKKGSVNMNAVLIVIIIVAAIFLLPKIIKILGDILNLAGSITGIPSTIASNFKFTAQQQEDTYKEWLGRLNDKIWTQSQLQEWKNNIGSMTAGSPSAPNWDGKFNILSTQRKADLLKVINAMLLDRIADDDRARVIRVQELKAKFLAAPRNTQIRFLENATVSKLAPITLAKLGEVKFYSGKLYPRETLYLNDYNKSGYAYLLDTVNKFFYFTDANKIEVV